MGSKIMASSVKLKRTYEPVGSEDGMRVLIDRLWPRGVKKSDAALDDWMKDIAPSTELRTWFGHDPARWPEFRKCYEAEIRKHPNELQKLRAAAQKGTVTLVYSAHDEVHNNAIVLRDLVLGRGAKRS